MPYFHKITIFRYCVCQKKAVPLQPIWRKVKIERRKMKGRNLLLLIFILICTCVHAQVTGVVLDESGTPMVGANVYWAGTTTGVATDFEGNFTLMPVKGNNTLVASFVGCHNDTIIVLNRKPLTIVLVDEAVLDEVTITERKQGVIKSRTSAFATETIGTEELCRAACCNLSEAFETNASVDVAYSDAATGAKQIRLLGLSGTYVQLIQENTPAVRGLAQNFGLEYIPGPWMSSIQVSKGTSSVINGYEATSGQINVELLKPQTQNPLSVNLMVNSEVMAEANIMGGWQLLKNEHEHENGHHHHESLYTGILAHYGGSYMAMDGNHDSFVDMPKIQNANLANRWFYKNGEYTFQAFVRGLYDRRRGGQIRMKEENERTKEEPYLINLNTWRVEGFLKNGYVYDEESGSSVALITAVSYHNLDNSYGLRTWKANQLNAYLNGIWQGNWEGGGLIDNDHRLSAGVSVNFDKYGETLGNICGIQLYVRRDALACSRCACGLFDPVRFLLHAANEYPLYAVRMVDAARECRNGLPQSERHRGQCLYPAVVKSAGPCSGYPTGARRQHRHQYYILHPDGQTAAATIRGVLLHAFPELADCGHGP